MRIAGVTIPDSKRLAIGLTELYGVGTARAADVLKQAGIDKNKKPTDISTADEAAIRELLEKLVLEGDLRRAKSGNIKRLKDIQAYRGLRHARNLPSRGQRTKTNGRTVRGNVRKTMGSGKRKTEKK